MMNCGQCGHENDSSNKFCSNCGAQLGYRDMEQFEQSLPLDHMSLAATLIDKLRSDSKNIRWMAAEKLGQIKAKEAIPVLLDILSGRNETEFQKWNIISVLGEIGEKSAISVLIPFLNTPDSYVRWLVIEALEKIHEPSTFETVANFVQDEDDVVRKQAIRALFSLDKLKAKSMLTQMRDQIFQEDHVLIEALSK